MSDDREPLSGSTDPVRPWTTRAEGTGVGQWLERRMREWCEEDDAGLGAPCQNGSRPWLGRQ